MKKIRIVIYNFLSLSHISPCIIFLVYFVNQLKEVLTTLILMANNKNHKEN